MADAHWVVEWRELGDARRHLVRTEASIGRSRSCDISVADPYVSRFHCRVRSDARGLIVDAENALNLVTVNGHDITQAIVPAGLSFVAGMTEFRVLPMCEEDGPTLRIERELLPRADFVLQSSTRELLDREGTLVAQFSVAEFLAFAVLAQRQPDAASHFELGRAVWGDMGYDQYQLHRLLQRIRQRLGDAQAVLENVRGAGYRLRTSIAVL